MHWSHISYENVRYKAAIHDSRSLERRSTSIEDEHWFYPVEQQFIYPT